MSAAIHLAGPEDLTALLPLIAAYHDEEGIEMDDAAREGAVTPLLDGSPHGCIYLIGPRRSPIGYLAVTFGWSIEFGGMEGFLDELFIRKSVRGRGIATELLARILPELDRAGVAALHLEASVDRPRLEKLYARAGFRTRDGYRLMTRRARA